MPTGDPQVREWSRAASEHAEAYVRSTLDPQMDDLHKFVSGQRGGGAWRDQALQDVRDLEKLVRTLPGEMAEQISQASSVDDVKVDAPLNEQISRMMNTYPWMAPPLVRLRHALSKQALEDNVAIPAGRQIGLG